MKRIWSLVLSVATAAFLAACGGGSDPAKVATADLSAPLTASATPALLGQTFTLPAVPDFGTTGTTTLAISGSATALTSAISSGGMTASGPMSFGSCIFTITQSNFPASSPLATGKVVTVNPCNVNVSTAGQLAGQTVSVSTSIQIGNTKSDIRLLSGVTISATGAVTIGGFAVGGVTLGAVTGGGS